MELWNYQFGILEVRNNTWTDTWTLVAGEPQECQVLLDVTNDADTPGESEDVTATLLDLTDGDFWTFRDTNTNDISTDIIPSGDIAGNQMDITAASLTVDVGSDPQAGNVYVQGSQDADMVAFTFTAGDSDDVTVNTIILTAFADVDGAAAPFEAGTDLDDTSQAEDIVGSVTLIDGETMLPIDNPDSLTVSATDSDITAQFDTLNWVIPAGTTKTLLVQGDITSTAPVGGATDFIAFAIAVAGDIDAEYGTGTSLTPTLSDGNTTPDIYQVVEPIGQLKVSLPDETPDTELVVEGGSVLATKVKFTSIYEGFKIEDLNVDVLYTGVDDDEVSTLTLGYWDESGTYQETTQQLIGGGAEANFTSLNPPAWVPANDDVILNLTANTTTFPVGEEDNGDGITLEFDVDEGFRALGGDSQEVLTHDDLRDIAGAILGGGEDITGNEMFVYESFPTFAWGNTVDGNLATSAQFLAGELEITAGAEDITFLAADNNELPIIVAGGCEGAATGDVTLKDDNGDELDVLADVALDDTTEALFVFGTNDLTIPANSTKTLDIIVNTQGCTGDGNSLQLYLDDNWAGGSELDWSINSNGGAYGHPLILFKTDPAAASYSK